jgi:Putative restriction endonuclease
MSTTANHRFRDCSRQVATPSEMHRGAPWSIEVSDTTLVKDRGVKKDKHGRAAIAVYWIINLIERQIEVYSGPRSDG